ncbi:unnamed protein product, partial [Darwinula stevensoni]
MRKFSIENNVRVKELPEGSLGNLSFQEISLSNTFVKEIHPSVILFSKDCLVNLIIQKGLLEKFPFDVEVIPSAKRTELRRLRKMPIPCYIPPSNLMSIPLFTSLLYSLFLVFGKAEVPALKSNSLEMVSLSGNKIETLEEDGWSTPNLKYLNIGCSLGPTLSSGLLEFRSDALKLVALNHNISRMELGAIKGLMPNTKVKLFGNKIAALEEGIFRPILEEMSFGTGKLEIWSSVICYRCKMKQGRTLALMNEDLKRFRRGQPDKIISSSDLSEQAPSLPYRKNWEFPREKLKLVSGKELGRGMFGVVIKAVAVGICPPEPET